MDAKKTSNQSSITYEEYFHNINYLVSYTLSCRRRKRNSASTLLRRSRKKPINLRKPSLNMNPYVQWVD